MINPLDYSSPSGDPHLGTPRIDSIRVGLQRVIEQEVEKIIEDEKDALAKRVEARVRGSVGGIAARVLEHFQMNMRGSLLTIEVKFSDTKI